MEQPTTRDHLIPCSLCGTLPVARPTDISLVAIACQTPACPAPVLLAATQAVGFMKWRALQAIRKVRPVPPKKLAHLEWVHAVPPPRAGYVAMARGS